MCGLGVLVMRLGSVFPPGFTVGEGELLGEGPGLGEAFPDGDGDTGRGCGTGDGLTAL